MALWPGRGAPNAASPGGSGLRGCALLAGCGEGARESHLRGTPAPVMGRLTCGLSLLLGVEEVALKQPIALEFTIGLGVRGMIKYIEDGGSSWLGS